MREELGLDSTFQILSGFQFGLSRFLTTEDIAGEYVCLGENEYGTRETSITITVQGWLNMLQDENNTSIVNWMMCTF